MSTRWRLVQVAALWAAAQSAAAQPPAPDPAATSATPTPPASISAATDDSERMTVPVRVDGQGPYAFVVDTGADRTVISRELAATLALTPGEPVLLNDIVGVAMIPTARIGDLEVGPRSVRDISAPTLSGAALGAAGMLGVDSLRSQRIVMDFEHNLMTVEPSRRERIAPEVIVVRGKSRYGQLILVDAQFGGAPIQVIVDTGAQSTIGNRALQHRLQAKSDDHPKGEVVSVSGQSLPADFGFVPTVRIGGVVIHNMPIAFADLHTFAQFGLNGSPAILLGMDVLRHFDRVVVDFGRREVRFQVPLAQVGAG